MPYQFTGRIRYSEVDQEKKLKIPELIDYFQDCSTFQSEDLGIGIDELQARGRAWVIASSQLEIMKLPKLGEKVITETWPHALKGCLAERNFRMLDEAGNVLSQANTVWAYLDVHQGHMARIDQDVAETYVLEQPIAMEKAERLRSLPEDSVARPAFTVRRSHLDTNHHVNNAQYIVMAQEYLPEDFEVHKLYIEYKKSALLGDTIVPMVAQSEGQYTIGLCDAGGKPYAVTVIS